MKPELFESGQNSFFTLHVYVRVWALGCFYSHISTQTFRRALTASLDSCAEIKECPFSGVTKSGSLEEGAGKRCTECGGSHYPQIEPSASAVSFYLFIYESGRRGEV